MKTGLCLICLVLCALGATAQPPSQPPASTTPEDAAARKQPVIVIKSDELLRRAPTTNNTLVVAGAPESPVVLKTTTVSPTAATAATPDGVKRTAEPPSPNAVGMPPTPPPPMGPGAAQPPTPPLPMPSGARPDAAPPTPPGPPAKTTFDTGPVDPNEPIEFDWMNADISQVLTKYSELTKRSAIMQQGLQGLVTFRSSGPLTLEEAIGALESVMLMNGFAIVPMGEKFFKVVPSTTGTMEGVPVAKDTATVPQFDRVIAQIVRVKYLDVTDLARALGGTGAAGMPMPPGPQPGGAGMGRVFMHTYGQIIPMPRSNALLLIDTALNVSRLKEIIEYMDTTSETKMETRVYVLENADAATVYRCLQTLVAADQGTTSPMAAAGMPGMPGQPTTFSATGSGRRLTTSIEESVLLGRVLMNYDDRTNAIILITQEVNFAFFEKIIKALDVKTNQDFKTRVFFLNYADALEMADMLYSFVQGAAPASTGRAFRGTTGTTGTTRGTAVGGATTRRSSTSGRNASSRSSRATMVGESRSSVAGRSTFGTGARQRARTAGTTPAAPGMPGGPTSPGAAQAEQLIEIIPDQRNNAIVAFAPEADLEAIAELIKQLDVFPPQVHIDVVVAEINISGDTTFGIDLLQSVKQKGGFAGAGGSRTLAQGFSDPKTLTKAAAVAGAIPTGGLTYFMTFFGDDLGAIIQALAQDDKFKVLQTPHLYTSNNQRARVFVGESRPFVTGTYTTDTGTRSNYENVDIGVGLEVTPLINPDGVVTFDIYQTVDQVSGTTLIDSNAVPIISRREAEAVGVTLKDGQIIVLGGLTSNSRHQIVSKTPVLGDIPLLGNLFKTTTWNDRKTELVFFMRPKVIRTLEEAQRYTWSFVEKNKDLRTMPIRDVEGYSPLMDKRYSAKLKALDRLDKSDRYGPGP